MKLHFPAADPTEFIESWNEARCVVMQGGQGEIKHWAFNDPVRREGAYKDESPSPEEYRKLGTRIVDLHPITLIQNARTSGGGCCQPSNQSASRWRLLLEAVSGNSNLPLTPLVPGPVADGPLGLQRKEKPPNGPDDPDYHPQERHSGMGAAPHSRGGVCCGQGCVTSSLTAGLLTGGQPTPPRGSLGRSQVLSSLENGWDIDDAAKHEHLCLVQEPGARGLCREVPARGEVSLP